jgi:hypothetical protein
MVTRKIILIPLFSLIKTKHIIVLQQDCDYTISFPGIGNGRNSSGSFPALSGMRDITSLPGTGTNGLAKGINAWYLLQISEKGLLSK